MKSTTLLLAAALVGSAPSSSSDAFSISAAVVHRPTVTSVSRTALHGAKRRGRLANNVSLDDDGNVKLISNKQKQKLGSASKKKGGKGRGDDAISPLLAEWAEGDGSPVAEEEAPSSPRKKKGGMRKNKKVSKQQQRADRAVLSAEQTERMEELLERITEMLGTTNCDVAELLSNIRALSDLNSSFSKDQTLLPTLKSILSARPPPPKGDDAPSRPAYRLAWVGSDDAICHVGTSLHKVPLARLQEMYLLLGYGKWELLEVIRILGPFPNVRNTLKGDIKASKLRNGGEGEEREGARMEVSYRSMIDGTGKEILAGKEDNVKEVNLDVWFANERAIVCTVPRSDDGEEERGDPLGGDGSNVLFFVAEENLDEELEKLRAA